MIRPRDRRAESGAGSRGPEDEAVAPEEHGSPGLAAIVGNLSPESNCRVLDLGPAVPANIRFYGEFASHVRVVDAVRDLAHLSHRMSAAAADSRASAALFATRRPQRTASTPPAPHRSDDRPGTHLNGLATKPGEMGGRAAFVESEEEEGEVETALDEIWRGVEGEFDVVMAWDLVSHVEPNVVRSVISRLHAVCRQGAKLFMMTYAGATMPALPQVFEIRTADRLLYRPASSDLVSAGDLPPAEVERLLTGFQVESSFLLRHGVREYAATRM